MSREKRVPATTEFFVLLPFVRSQRQSSVGNASGYDKMFLAKRKSRRQAKQLLCKGEYLLAPTTEDNDSLRGDALVCGDRYHEKSWRKMVVTFSR